MYNLFKCDVQLNKVREGQSIGQCAGESIHPIHRCEIQREKPIYTSVDINGVPTEFEINTMRH